MLALEGTMFGIDLHMWNSALKQPEFLNLLRFQTRRSQNCHFAFHVVSWRSETVGLGGKNGVLPNHHFRVHLSREVL